MCGILGFIGQSTNPKVSFELANALLLKTEFRGEHATGFYGCEKGNGVIFFDKEPVKSSIYVNRDIWKDFSQCDSNLLVAHCRFSSANVGHERTNRNNHPHVSCDKRVAVVHNGRIPEYTALKNRYDMASDCDSELLLRMFECSDRFKSDEEQLKKDFPTLDPVLSYRLVGIKDIFARIHFGAMAVAVAERSDDGSRQLWLFRDEGRPLHVVNMRKTLGQVFFCSTAEIWRSACDICPSIKPYITPEQSIIEFPPNQAWLLSYNANMQWKFRKFAVKKAKFTNWNPLDEKEAKINRKSNVLPPANVISRLNDDEELGAAKPSGFGKQGTMSVEEFEAANSPTDSKKKALTQIGGATERPDSTSQGSATSMTMLQANERLAGFASVPDTTETDTKEVEKIFEEIIHEVSDIDVMVRNKLKEDSLSAKDKEQISRCLKAALTELGQIGLIIGQ